eukprot:6938898-Prymnesium_polylepis.2
MTLLEKGCHAQRVRATPDDARSAGRARAHGGGAGRRGAGGRGRGVLARAAQGACGLASRAAHIARVLEVRVAADTRQRPAASVRIVAPRVAVGAAEDAADMLAARLRAARLSVGEGAQRCRRQHVVLEVLACDATACADVRQLERLLGVNRLRAQPTLPRRLEPLQVRGVPVGPLGITQLAVEVGAD